MNRRNVIFSSVMTFLCMGGMMLADFGPFYVQLQTNGGQAVNILIDDLMLSEVNAGFQPVYVNGEFSSFQNKTNCTVTFPTPTTVNLKFTYPSSYNPNMIGGMQNQTYPLMATNNQLVNSSEITMVSVGLPSEGVTPGMMGNKFAVNQVYPLFRYA